MKTMLEALKDLDGTLAVRVVVNEMNSSNREIALISSFESEEALAAYQVHPRHKEAKAYIGQVTCDRICFDFTE